MSQPPSDPVMQALAGFWEQAGKAALPAAVPGVTASPSSAASPPGTDPAAAGAVAGLWAAAASLSSALGVMLGAAGSGVDPAVEAACRAAADPRSWFAAAGEFGALPTPMGEGVPAGLGGGERQQARLTQAWLDLRRCALEHNAVLLDAWLRAGAAFNEAASRAQPEGHPLAGQAALALWATAANAVLTEAQRGENFLQTQAAMVRAGSEVRLAQRGLAEHWAAQSGLPTRTEVDEVHRAVTELRRELRALRRQAQGSAAPQP